MCPFGCRENHRRAESNRRSVKYYQDLPCKKQEQNAKRKRANGPKQKEAKEELISIGVLTHIQMVIELIAGRGVSRDEINEIINRKM